MKIEEENIFLKEEIIKLINFVNKSKILRVENEFLISEIFYNEDLKYSTILENNIYLISENGEKFKFNFNLISGE